MSVMPVAAGPGLTLVPTLEPELEVIPEPEVVTGEVVSSVEEPHEEPEPEAIAALRAQMREEMKAAVADIEFRLAQQYELMRRTETGVMDKVYVEDMNDGKHRVTGYTLTGNSPSAGHIAWASLHIVFLGVDWTITDGNTVTGGPFKYIYFIKPGAGTTATLQMSNTMPTLGANDAMIFINNNGTPISVLESSVTYAVGNNVISDAHIATSGLSQSVVTGLPSALNSFSTDIQRVEGKADGAITQYFGPDFPWANGTVQLSSMTGDVYTAQQTTDAVNRPNGRSWKWPGTSGAPPNTWVLITDSDLTKALNDSSSALGLVAGKSTVYYRTVIQGAPTPLAPAVAFTTGDQWVTTDNFNYTQRWDGTGWQPQLYGDAAISGVSGAKIGTGISGTNITTGVVPGGLIGTGISGTNVTTGVVSGGLIGTGINGTNVTTGTIGGARVGTGIDGTNITTGTVASGRVGAGVAGAVLNSATGTVGTSQIATGAVTNALLGPGAVSPTRMNTAFHMLY